MLTKADDFPIHQTPDPIAYAGTDRNFYDRYFFNGYSRDGEVFFAAAMGIYPHLNVIDAAFSVVRNGVQHNLHASRVLGMERMHTVVGPVSLTVLEPLKSLQLRVESEAHGIHADLVFHARASAIEEPRFTYRIGPRTLMDYTRLTQNGGYEGWIDLRGERIQLTSERVWGTRDRSWGIRPVGMSDPQPLPPLQLPQFYWLWAPVNYDDAISLYHINADGDGKPWNTRGVVAPIGDGGPVEHDDVESVIEFGPGTRRARKATIFYRGAGSHEARVELTPRFHFYMPGIGYMDPEWGHGHFKGDLAVGYDSYELAAVDDNQPGLLHIQAFCDATLTRGSESLKHGVGVLEQLIVGPHTPSGLTGFLDPWREA